MVFNRKQKKKKKKRSTNVLIVSAVPPQLFLSNTTSTLQNRVILTSTIKPFQSLQESLIRKQSVPPPNCQNLPGSSPDICGESCPVLHVLLPLETVSISESLDTDAYSHFNNVWQPINMAFCIVKAPRWLLFWLQMSHQNILD